MTNMTDILYKVNSELSRAQSTYYWLLISILASITWIVYLTYYNSRVFGLILTLCLNKFQKYGHIQFGSFSISVLSGKIMFRDVHWITEDYSVRIKFGYLIFRWWQPLTKKEYHEDLSHSYTRLTTYFENFEFHIYNYSSNFSKLEKVFGLDENIIPPSKSATPSKLSPKVSKVELNKAKWQWRDLIPVIKIDINASRIIFGNYLMPQSLVLSAREMHLVYTTKPASTPFDLFMHVVKCKTDNFKIMLVPSPKYSGKADEPPRCMGEGFAVVQSNDVEFYYYQDEPGLVPYEPESVYLANGDVVSIRTWPCWGMDVKCGKNTDFSYGPWCERQREFLWKFFFPPDFQPMKSDTLPNPGQLRIVKNFDFKMSMQNDITIDLLFTKQKETQAIHMNCKQGSYLEFTIPMFLEEAGYTFTMTGQLLHVDSSTSLKFRSLVECETLQFSVSAKYKSNWNDLQEITYDFTACKATGYLIYNHKTFFTELSEDWSGKARPDVYSFIPYAVKVNLILKEFEIITLTNQWNWIDCFGTSAENSHIAVSGDTFDMSLMVPFTDFMPNTVDVKLFIRGESAEALLYLPETNTNRHVLIGLSENLNVLTRDGGIEEQGKIKNEKKWSRVCKKIDGWIEVVSSPIVAVSLVYTYHPIPPLTKESPFLTPEEIDSEEAVLVPFKLIPLRPLRSQLPQKKKGKGSPTTKLFPDDDGDVNLGDMEPDIISLEIEVGPSVAHLYGSLVRNFLHLKENYFGEYQKFSDFEKNIETAQPTGMTEVSTPSGPVDPRIYRPFSLLFHLTLHDVQGHLVKNCSKDGEPCPSIYMERMVFEMDKRFHETKLQVFFSPILLVCRDKVKRSDHQSHLENGHLTLSAFQIRGNAMFSHQGLPLSSETLEYAWLIEITVGDLVGRMTSVQLQSVVEFLQTFVCMFEDKENELVCPNVYPMCQHMVPQNLCTKSGGGILQPCPTVSDLKYEFLRLSIDCVDFYLVESGTALCLQIYPVRLSNCNLFNKKTMMGLTILLPIVSLKHYALSNATKTSPAKDSATARLWIESGGFNFGPLNIDLSKTLSSIQHLYAQQEFLRYHDHKFQRLNFLWNADRCGCIGGCKFFGNNRNGSTFFDPSSDDFSNSLNVAVTHVCKSDDREEAFGFGQSILRNRQLIFYQPVLEAAKYFNEIFKNTSNIIHSDPEVPFAFQKESEHEIFQIATRPEAVKSGRTESTMTLDKSIRSRTSHDSVGSKTGLLSSGSNVAQENVKQFKADVLTDSMASLQQGTTSESSRINLSHVSNNEEFQFVDFPINQMIKTSTKVSTHDIDKAQPLRRLSLINTPSNQKWQSEKELSQMRADGSATFQYGSLSIEEKLESSKGSIYEVAPQSLEEKERSDGSLDSFVSAVSLSPDPVPDQTHAPLKVKWDETSSLTRQPSRAADRPIGDLPRVGMDKLQARPRKAPPTSLEIKSPSAKIQPKKKSPTMECYKCYLSQMQCLNWVALAPVSSVSRGLRMQRSSRTRGDETSENTVPHFVYYSRGFDCTTKLYKTAANKSDDENSDEVKTSAHRSGHFVGPFSDESSPHDPAGAGAEKSEFQVNDWIVVVKFKESVNAMLSPLMLDSLNNYIEASTPILSQMHPSSIVDMLNIKCLDSVNEQGDKTTSPSCFSIWSDPSSTSTTIDKLESEKFHVLVDLPQVNISMLQACIVEDKLHTHNVEKMHESTSVSLFIMCIDSIRIQMLSRAEIKSTSTLLMSNSVTPKNKKSLPTDSQDMHSLLISNLGNKLGVGKKKNQDNARLQKMLGQSNSSIIKCKSFSEVKKKSFITKMNMSRVHFQLRRSRSLSNTPDPLSLTAIPSSSSKVFFSFNDSKATESNPYDLNSSPYSWNVYREKNYHHSKSHDASKKNDQELSDSPIESMIGLLMFECGFENISFSAGGRFGYVQKETKQNPEEGEECIVNTPVEGHTLSSPELQPDDATMQTGAAKNASCFCTSRPFVKSYKEKVETSANKQKVEAAKVDGRASVRPANSSKSNVSTGPAEDKTDSTILDARLETDEPTKENEVKETLKGDASSFGLEIKTLWFNFAAPPASSKEMKFLSNKHDWNLLSTATPSINAWINSCHKITTGAKNMYDKFNRRMCSVMACLMTDALEVQGIHLMPKSKYNKTTWESKFLQDDPSCQLLTVMRKYIHQVGADAIEASLAEDSIPQSLTIRNGLLVLTRQWKNVLYLPMFDENSFKAKKKVTVTFAVPVFQNEEKKEDTTNTSRHACQAEDVELNLDNMDIIDESTSLLKAEGGSVMRVRSSEDSESRFQHHSQQHDCDVSYQLYSQKPMFLEPTSPMKKVVANDVSNLTLNSGYSSDHVVPLLSSSADFEHPSSILYLPASKSKVQQREDLQMWMNKQQEYLINHSMNAPLNKEQTASTDIHKKREVRGVTRENTTTSETSKDGSVAMHKVLASPTFQLVDAQVLFKPLLKSLGLHFEAVKMSAIMKKFGGELSMLANLKEIRVEIVDSESTIKAKLLKKRPVVRMSMRARPAFLCKHFSVTLSMKDMLDMETITGNRKARFVDPADADADREPVYLKTVQLFKDTIEQIEAKPATTKINFSVTSQSVTQHVNMSLLRLVHQFVTMVEDVAQTKSDLDKTLPSIKVQTEVTSDIIPDHKLKSQEPTPTGDKRTESKGATSAKRPDAMNVPTKRPLTVDELSELEMNLGTPQHRGKDPSDVGIPSPFKLFKVNGEPVVIETMDSASPTVQQKTIVDEIKATTPKCWKNLYHLLNLYNSMPDVMQTFSRSQLSVIEEDDKNLTSKVKKKRFPNLRPKPLQSSFFTQNIVVRERIPLIVFGTVRIKAINISAVLSGLKLHAELQSCQASFTHGEKIKGIAKKKSTESSVSLSVDLTTVTLLEGFQPALQQIVVQVKISRSNGIFSSFLKKSSENSVCLLSVGLIAINIPQHPVALHTMVVHSSKRLSNTLQEFIKLPAKNKSLDALDTPLSSSRQGSNYSTYSNVPQQSFSSTAMPGMFSNVNAASLFMEPSSSYDTPMDHATLPKAPKKVRSKPIVIHFRARVKGLIIGASLLPSLKSQYQIGEVTSVGVAGTKSKFTIHLLKHNLSFSSKVNVPSNIPTSASIALPPIHVQAEYLLQQQAPEDLSSNNQNTFTDGMVLREGNYLKAIAEVGAFEHVLTTDLLNHLVFVQKVFMKEVNEVVQKVSGSDQPVFLWSDTLIAPTERRTPLLYSFLFRLKSLQITATTPTNNAVRLETGKIEFELSNRVRRIESSDKPAARDNNMFETRVPKVFFQVKVDLNLALGTLIKNPMFEEAEAEFPHLASFATSITLRNALQDEIIAGASMDQEALLITLKRPIIFVLPSAFDKAILVWLNYRNAYEYWMEQRMALNKEIQMATQQVLTKIPPLTEGSLGILFLQMTVDDLGICLPMNPLTQKGFSVNREDSGFCGAMVLTLENAQISACSYGSFVCKGKFTGFCLRFAEDFEVSWDDWKPEKSYEFIMNALVVPNGTFEMCSRTINLRPVTDERKNPPPFTRAGSNQSQSNNAKWILNILWQMKGIDIHLDTNIGKRLNMVWNTLTSLAGETQLDDAALTNVQDVPTRVEQVARKQSAILQDDLPEFVFDLTLDSKTRARLIENEMNEQAKVVQDLKMLRASRNTIEEEERKLQGLQAALFNDFRQDIIKRFRYHSTSKKATESKLSSLTLSDHSHSRSTSVAGIKLHEDTNIKEVIESKNVEPHRVLESHSQTLKVTPSHLRTHSFDVSQLIHSKVDEDVLDGPRPNLANPIEEEQFNTRLPQAPTILSSQSIGKAPLPEVTFEEDFRLLEFSDEDFDYEDFIDSHESKDIDLSRNQNLPKTTKQIVEPAIDFELDVRAEIDSGKCVLHPKESKVEQTTEFDISLFSKKTKSSPKLFEKKRSAKKQADYFITQANRIAMVPNNNTVFFIPGVEVKLHYNSRTLTTADDGRQEKPKKVLGIKKANLYAWFSIQQLPEEMLISTSLLDFLEQAIEPIPIEPLKKASFKLNAVHSQMSQSLGSFGSSFASSNVQPYTSFPVDVVVYIRVQPSMVRFTCLPVSRVECLLRVPSLDIVFSTKKVDNYLAESAFSKKDRQMLLALDVAQGGGLSVSACMNDFSLYIFHPYGGGQKKTSGTNIGSTQSKVPLSKPTSMMEARKDSLSLNVEFIKVNISRSRVGVPLSITKSEHTKHQQTPSNVVQFSLVCDIGSASFKYDMRRLLEILALPKAWYRRTLARRLFLGEEMAVFDSDSGSDDEFMTYDISQFSSESSITDNMDDYKSKILQSASHMASLERLFLDYPPDKAVQIGGTSFSHHPIRNYPPPSTKTISSWETLVLVTVNLPQLDVMVNMSNAMGNTVWTTKGLQCQGKLKIDSAGYRNVNLCAGLKTSKLEAKGGIIGGLVEIQNLHAQTFVKEVPGKEPEHKVQSSLHTLETRLDYMGSAILIGRISDLMVQLNDEWQLQPIPKEAQKNPSVPRSVLVLIHGKLVWDKLHLMISRSTTPDLLKMVHKLEEFFSQQLMSGKRVLSTFGAGPATTKPKAKTKEETSANSWLLEVNLHRYWQHVLEKLVGCKLSVFSALLSNKGTVVGGSMNLVGKNISLACFHGMNFRSKFWALFTMDEPYIMFATEAADIEKEENKKMTQVIQNLTFQLRHNAMDMSGKRRMAMVYKLSRGHYMPPPFTSVQEWFHYAFATNDIKDLDKFPTTSKATPEAPATIEVAKKHAPRRMAEYSHDTEIIFILPSFQMHLKTIQLQQDKPPAEEDQMPVVECSFVTEFDDHIFVAMDAEAVLFLHDLITNYVKEKDKLDKMPKSPEMEKQKTTDNISSSLKKDIREFDCKTWHLEPTVRLLSWAGKEIDPVGVDYILQKLGFQHARLTIPKWMQRGFMDPLDKILSVLLSRLITALQETS